MDWKDMLASKFTEAELQQGAAENAADEAQRQEMAKEKQRLGTLHVEYSAKGRKGKPCTIVSGFEGTDEELVRLRKLLQQRLAVGGSSCWNSEEPFDGQILLQGDCRQKVTPLLQAEGYRVKG